MAKAEEFLKKEAEQAKVRQDNLSYISEAEYQLERVTIDESVNKKTLEHLETIRDQLFKISEDLVPEVIPTKDTIRKQLLDAKVANEFIDAVKDEDRPIIKKNIVPAAFLLGRRSQTVIKGSEVLGMNSEEVSETLSQRDREQQKFIKMSLSDLAQAIQKSSDRYEIRLIQEVLDQRSDTTSEIQKLASDRMKYLLNIDELESRISKLDRAFIAEISGYRKPLDEVLKVVNATLILLGESESTLSTWESSRKIFAQAGGAKKPNLKRRIDSFDPNTVTKEMIGSVDELLEDVALHEVEAASQPLGLLYSWCVVNSTYHNQQLVEETE